jgi:NDP-sugar pyrophosphorylase family protein
VCILAGGRGTRLGPLTEDLPKPLIPVAGRPFIEHQLLLLREHRARRIVISVGYRGAAIEAAIGDGRRLGLEIEYVPDGPRPLGTAGAIAHALPLLGAAFLVLYGDTYLRIDYGAVARARERSGLPALMTVLRNSDRWEPSNAIYAKGRVTAYDKRQPPSGARWIDYGLLALTPSAFADGATGDLADLQAELATRGRMAGYLARRRFYDIGTPERLRETEAFLRRAVPATPG